MGYLTYTQAEKLFDTFTLFLDSYELPDGVLDRILERVQKFNSYENLNYLAEFILDMTSYNYYTVAEYDIMGNKFMDYMLNNAAGARTRRMHLHDVFSAVFGTYGFYAIEAYAKRKGYAKNHEYSVEDVVKLLKFCAAFH